MLQYVFVLVLDFCLASVSCQYPKQIDTRNHTQQTTPTMNCQEGNRIKSKYTKPYSTNNMINELPGEKKLIQPNISTH